MRYFSIVIFSFLLSLRIQASMFIDYSCISENNFHSLVIFQVDRQKNPKPIQIKQQKPPKPYQKNSLSNQPKQMAKPKKQNGAIIKQEPSLRYGRTPGGGVRGGGGKMGGGGIRQK